MITGELKSKIDRVWDAFWLAGISNPIEVIEQITHLLFVRRLDELQTLKENRANRTGQPIQDPIFPAGNSPTGVPFEALRWKSFKNESPENAYAVVDNHVFPFLRTLGSDGSTYSSHMEGARLTIPTPGLLAKVIDMLNDVPMNRRDTNGDLYEYMLGKLSASGQNGQFRTPRHLIDLMVRMTAPTPKDSICDPACGTAGFLMAASEYVRDEFGDDLHDPATRDHFHESMFHGYDFDRTMLRIGSMNMLMHGVEKPDIRYRDSLSQAAGGDEGKYSLILANPPFAGSLDYEAVSRDLLKVVKTKKTELLFLARILKLLQPGGRAAVVVPDGVLFGSSTAHRALRRILVENHKLDAVVKLPAGAFKPYAGVSTAILFFTRTDSGGTDDVWFYDIQADGWSLDDKRQPLLDAGQLGAAPDEAFVVANHAKNNLPDVLDRWHQRDASEKSRPRTAQSFCVPKAEIVGNDYDFSLNRYRFQGASSRLKLGHHVVSPLPKNGVDGFLVVNHRSIRLSGLEIDPLAAERAVGRVTPLREGDIICRTIGEPRFMAIGPILDSQPLAADKSLHVIRPEKVAPDVLLAILRSEYVSQRIEARRYSGPGMPRITYENLLQVELPQLPSSNFEGFDGLPLERLRGKAERLVATLEARAGQAFSALEGDAALLEYMDTVTDASAAGRAIDQLSTALSIAQLTFPHPIARQLRAYSIARTSGDPRAESEAVLHLFEACLITLGATLGGCLASLSGTLNGNWRNNLRKRALSFGDWHRLASASASDLLARGVSLSGLADAAKQGSELDSLLKDFISWRNHRSHGSGPRTRSDFLVDNGERRLKIDYLIKSLRPMTRLQWRVVDDLDWDPNDQVFRTRIRDLRGDHPDFSVAETTRTSPVARGQVMVSDGSREWSLDGVLRYAPCRECGNDEFFYPDSRSEDGLLYRSLGRGHVVTSDFSELPTYLRAIVDRD
ncbi:hypothetical protein ASE27_04800 [Oerskovia sp. Root918]|uniref:type I restriction-modification system subunit M n=1 Tax=Oerskovia sp. Root918 TaxID=1736607 RepID=UPI0006F83768|nr:class I SAM-dependent DNA methyltransferase [Oerskovia sp. Root918]KRD40266.1 hypothetical protein ASE27_04800 [Oerskovia sp. Root918]